MAIVIPVRPLALPGYATAVRTAGSLERNTIPNVETTFRSTSVFCTIRIVAPITMQMPETKNISILASYSPNICLNWRSGSSQKKSIQIPITVNSGRGGTPKKRRIRAIPNGQIVMPIPNGANWSTFMPMSVKPPPMIRSNSA